MKIKRFFAKDMRTALAQVKETLGSDAVIMSNKKVDGGIEIVAAVDYDEPKPQVKAEPKIPKRSFMDLSDDRVSIGANTVRATKPAEVSPVKKSMKTPKAAPADSLQALLERQHAKLQQQEQEAKDKLDMPSWAKGLEASRNSQAALAQNHRQTMKAKTETAVPVSNEMQAMRDELASLRSLLTHQVSSLMTEKKQQVDPVGSMLETKLLEAEFTPTLAKQLSELTQHYKPADLVKALPQSLANLLDNQGDDIVHRGGVVALVGPTGVGKTTTLAKIAARFAAKHGNDHVALITMDHYRIGAYEQLATYGKIMGCPVKLAHDVSELEQILYQFRNRKLVLIDTAGMGQRDQRLYQQLDNLNANKRIPIRNYLVLSATAQRRVLQEAVEYFKRVPLAGAVLTKLDESVSLASALSVLIANKLPLNYVTDGQRVPEDIHLADTFKLAEQALSVLDESEPEFVQRPVGATELAHAFE
ncbi:flagellar biosynthesis protein FlhF [Shewanella sp. 202IG2-18]|uniref:flagellar biosynthesis protein FlhF n=1 Tax=Parashewanella hymeniacidonis TaxID=2807618 RepID=UPI00196180B2|nr:flagellar biosynthesis protein FlhF [Parashewanella hymeniacidonis]